MLSINNIMLSVNLCNVDINSIPAIDMNLYKPTANKGSGRFEVSANRVADMAAKVQYVPMMPIVSLGRHDSITRIMGYDYHSNNLFYADITNDGTIKKVRCLSECNSTQDRACMNLPLYGKRGLTMMRDRLVAVFTGKYRGYSAEDVLATEVNHIDRCGLNDDPNNLEVVPKWANTLHKNLTDILLDNSWMIGRLFTHQYIVDLLHDVLGEDIDLSKITKKELEEALVSELSNNN